MRAAVARYGSYGHLFGKEVSGDDGHSYTEAKVVEDALKSCDEVYQTEIYPYFRDVHPFREYDMARVKMLSEQAGYSFAKAPIGFVNCFSDEFWRTAPEALRIPADTFLKDNSLENWMALNRSIAAVDDIDHDRRVSIKGECEAKHL